MLYLTSLIGKMGQNQLFPSRLSILGQPGETESVGCRIAPGKNMYIPEQFVEQDFAKITDLVNNNPFGMLITKVSEFILRPKNKVRT